MGPAPRATEHLLEQAFDLSARRALQQPDIAAGLARAGIPDQVLLAEAVQHREVTLRAIAAEARAEIAVINARMQAAFDTAMVEGRRRTSWSRRLADKVRSRLAPPPTTPTPHGTRLLDAHVTELLRRLLNTHLEPVLRTSLDLPADGAPGLSGDRTPSPAVTEGVARFQAAARRVGTGALGLAGPRGVGKSTVIEHFAGLSQQDRTALKISVSAPVQYDPREFVLHLFARICQAVISASTRTTLRRHYWARTRYELARMSVLTVLALGATYLATAAVVGWGSVFSRVPVDLLTAIDWRLLPAVLLGAGAFLAFYNLLVDLLPAVGHGLLVAARWLSGNPRTQDRMVVLARAQLTQIRYLQTHTTGWSGKFAVGGAEGSFSTSRQLAEKPLTYPEISDAFHRFLGEYAAARPGHQVLITVDELDKITTAESAEHFLNEIKGLFGAPGTQFVVSVSDDALAAFERRGLAVRDAFDSAFQEIVRIDPLSLADTVRLLDSWVVGLPEPFARLAYCLGGGLPREVRRVARAMVGYAAGRAEPPTLDEVCAAVVGEDLDRKAHAVQVAVGRLEVDVDSTRFLREIRGLRPTPVSLLEAVRKWRGHDLAHKDLAPLRGQTSTYLYHCATVLELFTRERDERVRAEPDLVATFDLLAAAKQSLGAHRGMATVQIDDVRAAWGLRSPWTSSGRYE
ncbi:hypothetical protein [Actinokineospora enzanensis]|uniref:hypothetical protein n=1 Tax=Actinokineospora enzanensis TaxID=155975 RepID=UPI00037FFC43|nr:hypothetical protein [Actinokineospora enzanensis]